MYTNMYKNKSRELLFNHHYLFSQDVLLVFFCLLRTAFVFCHQGLGWRAFSESFTLSIGKHIDDLGNFGRNQLWYQFFKRWGCFLKVFREVKPPVISSCSNFVQNATTFASPEYHSLPPALSLFIFYAPSHLQLNFSSYLVNLVTAEWYLATE